MDHQIGPQRGRLARHSARLHHQGNLLFYLGKVIFSQILELKRVLFDVFQSLRTLRFLESNDFNEFLERSTILDRGHYERQHEAEALALGHLHHQTQRDLHLPSCKRFLLKVIFIPCHFTSN